MLEYNALFIKSACVLHLRGCRKKMHLMLLNLFNHFMLLTTIMIVSTFVNNMYYLSNNHIKTIYSIMSPLN